MAQVLTRSTKLNSLWTIFYCFVVLGVQGYITFQSVQRYVQVRDLPWLTSIRPPPEVHVHIILISLSLICVPFFIYLCVVRVGNYANDGIKLGRDHAIHATLDHGCSCLKSNFIHRLWCHFCPLAQSLHVFSAFFLLLPETFLYALEIKYGFRDSVDSWRSDMDFMFKGDRILISDTMAKYQNGTAILNSTIYRARLHQWRDSNNSLLDISFLNFIAALLAFSVRYAAVFWYTNKIISLVFSGQLILLTIESVFSFSGFSVLYKVAYNYRLYKYMAVTFRAPSVVVLYVLGGAILLFSTITVFEYGCFFFNEKYKIISRKHQPETYVKQSSLGHTGCQGYIPHTMAMISLILLASFKGPLIYDLVKVYRMTKDGLALACIIIDISYMVYWIILWMMLTVRQQWKFRILDYIPLGRPIFMVQGDQVVSNPTYEPDTCSIQSGERKHRPVPVGSSDTTTSEFMDDRLVLPMSNRSSCASPANTESSLDDFEPRPLLPKKPYGKHKTKRANTPRVTFDTNIRTCASIEKNIHFQPLISREEETEIKQLCSDLDRSIENASFDGATGNIVSSNLKSDSLPRKGSNDYSANIRNKCEEYYTEINKPNQAESIENSASEPVSIFSSFNRKNNTPRSLSYADRPNKLDVGTTPVRTYSEYRSNLRTPKFSFLESKDSGIQADHNGSANTSRNEVRTLKPFSTFLGDDTTTTKDSAPTAANNIKVQPLNKNQLSVLKQDIGRRDSANYSLTSSQDTSSTESGNGLCTENQTAKLNA